MLKAYCLIRAQPYYRRDAFIAGLAAAGYEVVTHQPERAKDGDVLCIWNRYSELELLADRFEAQGGTVIVSENGYLNKGGRTPKFDVHEKVQADHYYALALHQHNGGGTWPAGDASRWDALGIDVKPWRTGEGHILICPNRQFGSRVMQPPANWVADVAQRLRGRDIFCDSEIRTRPHPGNTRPARSLAQDLEGCAWVVIWASSSGVHALVEGIPVYCDAPHWICKDGDNQLVPKAKRMALLARLAWAQWRVDEISTGEPFRRLLQDGNGKTSGAV